MLGKRCKRRHTPPSYALVIVAPSRETILGERGGGSSNPSRADCPWWVRPIGLPLGLQEVSALCFQQERRGNERVEHRVHVGVKRTNAQNAHKNETNLDQFSSAGMGRVIDLRRQAFIYTVDQAQRMVDHDGGNDVLSTTRSTFGAARASRVCFSTGTARRHHTKPAAFSS